MPNVENKKSSQNLPWVEKYRPNALQELISHEDIINTIRKFIHEDKLPHLLFSGPPGTGKTSTILACAKEIYSPKELKMVRVEAKLRIWPRTTLMPRSSEALSSSTIELNSLGE